MIYIVSYRSSLSRHSSMSGQDAHIDTYNGTTAYASCDIYKRCMPCAPPR